MKNNTSLESLDILENPTQEEVMKEYILKNKPVLIRGVVCDWPAYKKWSGAEFLQKYGGVSVLTNRQVKHDGPIESKEFTLSCYLQYIYETTDDTPYYLTDWSFSAVFPELVQDYNVPEYFKNWLRRIPDEKLIGNQIQRWIYIGAKNTGTIMHRDFLHSSSWNAVITGAKRWVFYSDNETENVYNGDVDAFNPDLTTYPNFSKAKGYTCIQKPGDMIFTPSLWWHQVKNVEAGISINENFINETNINIVANNYINNCIGESVELDELIKIHIPEIYDV